MNKITKILGIIVLIIIFVWIVIDKKNYQEKAIKIGAILPLTGSTQYLGQFEREGIDLAVEEINKKGGINDKKIEIIYEDSRGDVKEGISAYQRLVDVKNIKLILTTESGTTLALSPLAEKNKVIVFSIAGADSKISNSGDYIFRHNLLPKEEANFISQIIFNKGFKNIGLLILNTDSGNSYIKEIKNSFENLGGKISIIQTYEKGLKDFRTQLLKIKNSKLKAIFVFGHSGDIGFVLKQGHELGINNIQWFGSFATEGKELLDVAGELANGLIFSHFFNENSSDIKFIQYKDNFENKYKKLPEAFGSLAYDNIYILAKVIGNCFNKDEVCFKDELYKIDSNSPFFGVTGKVFFDNNGDTSKSIILKTVKNGQFVSLEN